MATLVFSTFIFILLFSHVMLLYKAKSLLKKKNIFFHEINVDLDYNQKEKMIIKSNGRTSVPQIFFGDYHVGGCDDLFQLEKDSDLRNFI